MYDQGLKDLAIRLRVEEQKSFPEIRQVVKVSKSTLSLWLRDYPLTMSNLKARRVANGHKFAQATSVKIKLQSPAVVESNLSRLAKANELGSNQMGKLAEAAVLLRLILHGFQVFGSVFDGEKSDWIATCGDKTLKIQVKKTHLGKHGVGCVPLTYGQHRGRRRYQRGDFDFLVGYDLYTDRAYVWSWDETAHLKSSVSLTASALEGWDKLRR